MPVSRDVPLRAATIGSMAGIDVLSANGARHVSTTSTPASIAFKYVMDAMPLV